MGTGMFEKLSGVCLCKPKLIIVDVTMEMCSLLSLKLIVFWNFRSPGVPINWKKKNTKKVDLITLWVTRLEWQLGCLDLQGLLIKLKDHSHSGVKILLQLTRLVLGLSMEKLKKNWKLKAKCWYQLIKTYSLLVSKSNPNLKPRAIEKTYSFEPKPWNGIVNI